MKDTSKPYFFCLALFIFSCFIYLQGLSLHGVEYRDDEIFYYKSTVEMVESKEFLSPTYFGADRFQKPILYYWFILLGYELFGVGWFGARFFSAVFAAGTVVINWLLAREMFSRRTATLSSLILLCLPMFFRHARNAVPDMAMNFFIVLAMFFLIRFIKNPSRWGQSVLCFIACAFGFMIKGFAAFIVPLGSMIIFCVYYRRFNTLIKFGFLRGTAVMLLIILPWFAYMIATHGQGYLDYMLGEETASRLMGNTQENLLWLKLVTFVRHLGFYAQTMFAWFAPFSLFLPFALVYAVMRSKADESDRQLNGLLLIWFFLVYIFFSFMYFKISHYVLVLSSSFSILTAAFLAAPFEKGAWSDTFLRRFRWISMTVINVIALIVVGFLIVFIAGGGVLWLGIFLMLITAVIFVNTSIRSGYLAAVILAVSFGVIQSQSWVLAKTKLTSHSTFQQMSQELIRLNGQEVEEYEIGVASHDLHEKELQIYFDKQIFKAGHSWPGVVEINLAKLFAHDKVYCFVLQKDFEQYQKFFENTELVLKDYIIRKRFYLDKDFVMALLRFDKPVIHDYLYEDILLVRKDTE